MMDIIDNVLGKLNLRCEISDAPAPEVIAPAQAKPTKFTSAQKCAQMEPKK